VLAGGARGPDLIGLARVVVGSFLYFSHWQAQQLQLNQAQTQPLIGALQGIQATLDQLATTLATSRTALLATPGGTISQLARPAEWSRGAPTCAASWTASGWRRARYARQSDPQRVTNHRPGALACAME
jgi:hypothetical protein